MYAAFDTETHSPDGRALLISYASASGLGGVCLVDSFRDCVRALVYIEAKSLWAYNLDYDARAIIAHLSPELQESIHLGRASCVEIGPGETVSIDYLPGKHLQLTYTLAGERQIINCWDCWQYFETSLETTARSMGFKGKHKISPRTIKRLGTLARNGRAWKRVMAYSLRDAQVTLKIVERLLTSFASAGLISEDRETWESNRYYSAGYFAKRLLGRPLGAALSREEVSYMKAAYSGGRVETYKRGRFGRLFLYDINSAYPSNIAKMPSLESCRRLWTVKPLEGALAYVSRVRVWTKPGPIQPFPVRTPGGMFYPILAGRVLTLHQSELEAGLASGMVEHLEYLKTWNLIGPALCPHAGLVQRLYDQKSQRGPDYWAVKKVLNSLYGVFAERVREYGADASDQTKAAGSERRLYLAGIQNRLGLESHNFRCSCPGCKLLKLARRAHPAKPLKGYTRIGPRLVKIKEKAGRLQNFFYAGYITAGCRAVLLRGMALKPGATVFCATDSIASQEPLPLTISADLGAWGLKELSSALVVSNGVYRYKRKGRPGVVTRFRGFDSRLDIRAVLRKAGKRTTVFVEIERPVGLSEALRSGARLNAFQTYKRRVSLDDWRRLWPPLTAKALLTRQVVSKPLTSKPFRVYSDTAKGRPTTGPEKQQRKTL